MADAAEVMFRGQTFRLLLAKGVAKVRKLHSGLWRMN